MTTEEILAKVENYYGKEYNDVVRSIEYGYATKESIDAHIKCCLGVAFFAQDLGVPYKDIDKLYNEVRVGMEGQKKILDK